MKRAPDTFIIIFLVVVLAGLLTHIIPQGKFEQRTITYQSGGETRTRLVPDPNSFTIVKDENGKSVRDGIGLFDDSDEGRGLLNYLFEGLVSGSKWGTAVGVVAFIIIIGGAFGIILKTGSIEALIHSMIRRYANSGVILIPILFVLFSSGGAIFGMGESAMAFAMILVPMMISLGYDSIVGVMITYVATQIGFATSWMNPFSVAIGQSIAGIPVMSGAVFRIIMWLFFTALGIAFTLYYASRIRKNPESSLVYKSDDFFRKDLEQTAGAGGNNSDFTVGHKLVLLTLLAGIIWVVVGVTAYGYYIPQMSTQFFIMGLVSGSIGAIFKLNGMTFNGIAESFRKGAADILGAALVVGMAKGILIVLGGDDATEPNVLNTVLHSAGEVLKNVPAVISAWSMFIFQAIFNFFVVSGTGQAALTMPIMAPLADIVGVSRQVAVLAFQLGDGFTNLIVPTSGALIGALGVARIDWLIWARFQIKFQILLFALGSLIVILGFMIGFN